MNNLSKHFKIIHNIISQAEADLLVLEADKKLRRIFREYEPHHFDNVIRGYRECTATNWNPASQSSLETSSNNNDLRVQTIMETMQERIRRETGRDNIRFCSPHILDLKDGQSGILAHVDNLQASGSVISGLSLISNAVIIFKAISSDFQFRILIPPNSLYIQTDTLRFKFTHEIPLSEDENHSIDGNYIVRKRRLSIILRDIKN